MIMNGWKHNGDTIQQGLSCGCGGARLYHNNIHPINWLTTLFLYGQFTSA